MPISKTLSKAAKAEKEKFTIPKSVQDAIPIQRIWPDGIFQVGRRFSKTFSFTDINYSIASKDDKTAMFLDYAELLNALDSGASAKITINNRKVNKAEFEKSLLLPMKEDGLDPYRKEYNEMLLSTVTGVSSSVVQDRYITITVAKRNIDEARTYFSRVGTDLITHLAQLSSIGRELDIASRLQIFRDFFKGNEPAAFAFDLKEHMQKGHSFKDWLCPGRPLPISCGNLRVQDGRRKIFRASSTVSLIVHAERYGPIYFAPSFRTCFVSEMRGQSPAVTLI